MATYQIAPPERFPFTLPNEWPKWSKWFERFRQASGLAEKDEESQVNFLIYAMGEEANDILSFFRLTEEDAKKYDTVKSKLESHFIKRPNVVFEWVKFNQCVQDEGESADAFITSLYCLAEKCNYGNLHEIV